MGAQESTIARQVIPTMRANVSSAPAQVEGLRAIAAFLTSSAAAAGGSSADGESSSSSSNTAGQRCAAAVKAGALGAVASAMNAHRTHAQVQTEGLRVLAALLAGGGPAACSAATVPHVGAADLALHALRGHASAPPVAAAACAALAALVPSPSDASAAVQLLLQAQAEAPVAALLRGGAAEALVAALAVHTDVAAVQGAACAALAAIAGSGKAGRDAAFAAGAVNAGVAALRSAAADSSASEAADVLRGACRLLASVAVGNDAAAAEILAQGGVGELVSALRAANAQQQQPPASAAAAGIAEAACLALGNVAARNDACAAAEVAAGVPAMACAALRAAPSDARMQRAGLFLVAALLARGGAPARNAVTAAEGISLFAAALRNHRARADIACYALAAIADICTDATSKSALSVSVAAAATSSANGSVASLLIATIRAHPTDGEVQSEAFRAICTICGAQTNTAIASDTAMAESFVREGAAPLALAVLRGTGLGQAAATNACLALSALSSCKPQQPLGKDGMGLLAKTIGAGDHSQLALVGAACLALGRAVAASESDKSYAVRDGDGPVVLVVRAMVSLQAPTQSTAALFQLRCCAAISCLAASSCVVHGPGDVAISPVVSALREHGLRVAAVAEESLRALASLFTGAIPGPTGNKGWAADAGIWEGFAPLAAEAIRAHGEARPGVIEQGCRALAGAITNSSTDLVSRIFQAESGALAASVDALRNTADEAALESAANFLAVVSASGEPGRAAVCAAPGVWKAAQKALDVCSKSARPAEALCRMIANTAVTKEVQSVADDVIESGAAKSVVVAMCALEVDAGVQEAGTLAIANLAARGGKATADLGQLECIAAVVSAMNAHTGTGSMQRNGCFALGVLSSGQNDPNRVEILRCGGVLAIVNAMTAFPLSEVHQKFGCIALGNLARCMGAPAAVVRDGGIGVLLAAMRAHASCQAVQAEACRTLGKLYRSDPAAIPDTAGREAVGLVIAAARGMSSFSGVQECVVGAIAAMLASGDAGVIDSYTNEGANELLLAAAKAFPDNASIQRNVCTSIAILADPTAAIAAPPNRGSKKQIKQPVVAPSPHAASPPAGGESISFLVSTMRDNQVSDAAQETSIRGLEAIARASKPSAASVASEGGLKLTLEAMRSHRENTVIQDLGVMLITALAFHQVDAALGRGESGHLVLGAIVAAMRAHAESVSLQMHGCSAFATIAAAGGHRSVSAMLLAEAIPAVVAAMTNAPTKGESNVLKAACHALAAISSASQDTTAVSSIADVGGVGAVIGAMALMQQSAGVQELGCLALANMGARSDALVLAIYEEGGIDAVMAAFRAFGASSAGVQRGVCFAIAVLASRKNEVPRAEIGKKGAVSAVLQSLQNSTDVHLFKYGMVALANLVLAPSNVPLLERDDAGKATAHVVVTALQMHCEIPAIVSEAARSASKLAVASNVLMNALASEGVVAELFASMKKFPQLPPVLRYSCAALAATIGVARGTESDANEAFALVLKAMRDHPMDPNVQEGAAAALAALSARSDSFRSHLGKSGAPALVVAAMRTHLALPPVQKSCCAAMCSLTANGQNSSNSGRIVESGGIGAVIGTIRSHSATIQVLEEATKALADIVSSEASSSRPATVALLACDGAIDTVVSTMQLQIATAAIRQSCCQCLEKLTRFPGIQSEQIAAAACKARVLRAVIGAMKEHKQHAGVQEEGCLALSNLAAAHLPCRSALAKETTGGIQEIVSTLKAHQSCVSVQENGARALANISAFDSFTTVSQDTSNSALVSVLGAMRYHATSSAVQECCCLALANMVARSERSSRLALREGAASLIVSAMRAFPMSALVQKNACFALAALAAKAKHPERECLVTSEGSQPLSAVVASLRVLQNEELVLKYGAIAIGNMAQEEDSLDSATISEVVPVILTSMRSFPNSEAVQSEFCRALGKLCTGRNEAIASSFRLGAIPVISATIRTLPKPSVLLRAFGALSKVLLLPEAGSSAAGEDVRLVETMLPKLFAFPTDAQLRKAACKVLECIPRTNRADVAALIKAAVPGQATDSAAMWATAALVRGGGEAARDEFLQCGIARMLADIFATSQSTEELEAACAATAALASVGDVPSSSITQLAPSVEAAVSRSKLSSAAKTTLAVVRRTVAPMATASLSRGFCASASAFPSEMIFTRPCLTCGSGMRVCDVCAARCHKTHTFASEQGSLRAFGVHGPCGCTSLECRTIKLLVQNTEGGETSESSVLYSGLGDAVVVCNAAYASFGIPASEQSTLEVAVLTGDPAAYTAIQPGLPLPLSFVVSPDVPMRVLLRSKEEHL